MDSHRPKRVCNKTKNKNNQQNTIPSMIHASKNKADKVQKKNAERLNIITVKTVSNPKYVDDETSSDDSIITVGNRSLNFTPKRKSDAHSVLELNSSLENDEIDEIEKSNSNLIDDTAENILFQKYFHIVPGTEDEKKNVTAKCVACSRVKPTPVHCRGSKDATSNFIRHLKKHHTELHSIYLEEKKANLKPTYRRRKCTTGNLPLTQDKYENVLVDLIIDGMLPMSIVSLEAFKRYTHEISTGLPNPPDDMQYKIISPNTVGARVDDMYAVEKIRLTDEYKNVEYFCATADIWSTKHKSYMGATVHWIDSNTSDRKSNVLCCRLFESPHTADRIASMLNSVYNEFDIVDKILVTVTDNASNFVRAFNEFGIPMETFVSFVTAQKRVEMTDSNSDLCTESSDDWIESDDIPKEDEEIGDIIFSDLEDKLLSDHFRCGSHTFCLLASKDSKDAFDDVEYATWYKDVFDKINALYKKSNRPKSSEIIKRILKKSLILPAATRWNSLFDSIEHILSFDLVTLNILMLELGLSQFTQENYDFLREYLKVMEGVAFAVDNLQSSNSYYAIFLPTLHSIKYLFDDLESLELVYCLPLLEAIKAGFNKRFERFFNQYDDQCIAATIAAVTHPHFKMRWLYKRYQTKLHMDYIRELLIEKAMDLPQQLNQTESGSNETVATGRMRKEKKRFQYRFTEKRDTSTYESIRVEISTYLGSPESNEEKDLTEIRTGFPHIRALFIKYNTIISSSAPVERLFSFANMILRPQRQNLNDGRFEKLLLLKHRTTKVCESK